MYITQRNGYWIPAAMPQNVRIQLLYEHYTTQCISNLGDNASKCSDTTVVTVMLRHTVTEKSANCLKVTDTTVVWTLHNATDLKSPRQWLEMFGYNCCNCSGCIGVQPSCSSNEVFFDIDGLHSNNSPTLLSHQNVARSSSKIADPSRWKTNIRKRLRNILGCHT